MTLKNYFKDICGIWSLFEGQGLRARLCCRKISDSIFWFTLFHSTLTSRCNALPQRKVPKEIYKKKRIETDKRRKHFFHTFLYLLGEGTNRRYVPRRSVVPKTPDSKMVLLVWRTLPERERYFAPFIKRKSFFLFMHASSPFPLETSGSFFKFNSFLFIYLFIFLDLIFYLFIRSLHILKDILKYILWDNIKLL